MNFLKANYLLAIILISSLILKLWQLDINPSGFFADEASAGYEAWHILNFGTDRHGEKFPLFFKGFYFDNLSPYHIYLNIPPVILFGLKEFAIRLTPVVGSTIELLVFYLLMKELIPKHFALAGVLLLSITPWHFHLSRNHMADYYSWPLFSALGYLFLIKALKCSRLKYYSFSSAALALGSYSYVPARLTAPLIFSLIMLLLLLQKKFRLSIFLTTVFIIVLTPFIYFHLFDPNSLQRIKDTAGLDLKSSELKSESISLGSVIKKYPLHFSPTFLFEKGDADYPDQFIKRHSIIGIGLFHNFQQWLILLGTAWLGYQLFLKKTWHLWIIPGLLILFPIPDSLTFPSTPYATRSYLGILPLSILSSMGVYALYLLVSRLPVKRIFTKIVFTASFLLVVGLATQNLITHFLDYPHYSSNFYGWQFGPREIITYFISQKDNYDQMFMSGEFNGADIFLKFYDSENLCLNKCLGGDFFREPTIVDLKKKQLFSLSPDYLKQSDYSAKFAVKKTVYYPDGEVAFLIGEIVH